MIQARSLMAGRSLLRGRVTPGLDTFVVPPLSLACTQQSFQSSLHDRYYFGYGDRNYSASTNVLLAKIPGSRIEPRIADVPVSMSLVDRVRQEEEELERNQSDADTPEKLKNDRQPKSTTPASISPEHRGFVRDQGNKRVKLWNNTDRPLPVRVKALINARRIHPADISAPFQKGLGGSAMEKLIESCCMKQNLEGMHLAQFVIDRLLVEKERVKKQNKKDGASSEKDLILPIGLWDQVLFGWTQLLVKANSEEQRRKNQLTSAPPPIYASQIVERMQEVVQSAVYEAKKDDEESFSEFQESKVHSSRPTTKFMNLYLYGISLAARVHEQEKRSHEDEDDPRYTQQAQNFLQEMIYLANKRKGWYTRPNTKSYMHIMQTIAHCDLNRDGSTSSSESNGGRGQLARSFLDHIQGLSKQLRKRHLEDDEVNAFDGFLEKHEDGSNATLLGDGDTAGHGPSIAIDKQLYTSCLVAISKSIGGTHNITLEDVLDVIRQGMQVEVEADKKFMSKLAADPSISDKSTMAETVSICDGPFVAMAFKVLANMMQEDTQLQGDKKQRMALGHTAEKLLQEFLVHWETRHERRLEAWLQSNNDKSSNGSDNDNSVPNPIFIDSNAVRQAYNGCIDVWARSHSNQGAPQCEALLFSMISTSILNHLLDDSSVDDMTKKLIRTELKARDSSGRSSSVLEVVEPDTVSFNSVMYAWSRSHAFYYDRAAARAAELLKLQQILSENKENRMDNLVPDTQSFTIAILAQSKGPGGDNIEMKEPRLRLKTALDLFKQWRTMLDSKVTNDGGSEEEEVGKRKFDQEDLLVAPFSALLKVIHELPSSVDRRSAKRSRQKRNKDDAILQLLEYRDDQNDSHLGIDDLDSLSGAVERVDLYDLSVQIYNCVLDDALKLGQGLYPNHHFYAAFLSCVEKHLHPNSTEFRNMTEQVWLDACESGEVSRIVWPRILSMARHIDGGLPRLLGDDVDHFTSEELLQYTSRRNERNPNTRKKRARARVSQLPRHWWRNVPPSWK